MELLAVSCSNMNKAKATTQSALIDPTARAMVVYQLDDKFQVLVENYSSHLDLPLCKLFGWGLDGS